MSLEKNLTKFGNSYGLIIDKAILDMLNIEPTTPLNISSVTKNIDKH